MRRLQGATAGLLAAVVLILAGCGGGEAPPTTPTIPSPSTSGGGGARDPGVEVQPEAFPAGGGSGIVASKQYPGVLWAIRDRGARDRPGRPRSALYAYKVTGGRVAKVGGAAFRAVPLAAPNRDWEDIARDDDGNLAVDTHTALFIYQAGDPSAGGAALVADLISRPRPGRSSSAAARPAGARPTSRASPSAGTATTSTCWPRTATSTSCPRLSTSAEAPPAPRGRGGARAPRSRAGGPPTAAGPHPRGRRPAGPRGAGRPRSCRPAPRRPGSRPG